MDNTISISVTTWEFITNIATILVPRGLSYAFTSHELNEIRNHTGEGTDVYIMTHLMDVDLRALNAEFPRIYKLEEPADESEELKIRVGAGMVMIPNPRTMNLWIKPKERRVRYERAIKQAVEKFIKDHKL